MDAKRYVREYLRSHQGVEYSAEELAMRVNESDQFEIPIKVHPEEVQTYGQELAREEDKVRYSVSEGLQTVIINGERRSLLDDYDWLRYNIVAELAPDREDEIVDLTPRELREWIVDELAEEVEPSGVEHSFKWEAPK